MYPEEIYFVKAIDSSVFNRYPHIPIYYNQRDLPLHKFEAARRAFYDEFSWCFRHYGYDAALIEWLHNTSDIHLETNPMKQFRLLSNWELKGFYGKIYCDDNNEEYSKAFYSSIARYFHPVFNQAQDHYQKEGSTHAAE